jgi:hypothetical protein
VASAITNPPAAKSRFRAVYELQGEGVDGDQRYFRKPWFMATVMFLGMSLCLPLSFLEERMDAAAAAAAANNGDAGEPLLHSSNGHTQVHPQLSL